MENGNEMVTKSMFLEGMDHLACLVNKGFVDIEKRMATKDELGSLKEDLHALTERVENLEKDMRGVFQRFDALFIELREIREEIKEIVPVPMCWTFRSA